MPLAARFVRRWVEASAIVAITAVTLILLFTLFEIGMRSVGRPTTWVLDTCAYLLCLMVGASFPAITAKNGNVAITLLVDSLRPAARIRVYRFIDVVSGLVCAIAAVLCVMVLNQQFSQGITTLSGVVIPKWVLTAVVLHGFVGSSVMHLVHAASGRPGDSSEKAL